MKYTLSVICFTIFCMFANAQSRLATVEFQKVNKQAVVNDISFSEKTVRDAIDNKMEQMGYKGKEVKDFVVYKGVKLPELGNDVYDLYFTADKKGRKDKDNSVLTLMISKGIDNFVDDTNDAALMANAQKYMDNIKNMIAAYDLELQVTAQEDAIKNADKKYNKLVDDGQNLEKKRKNIENDIENNKKDQTNQQAEIIKQKQILDNLRAQRKTQ